MIFLLFFFVFPNSCDIQINDLLQTQNNIVGEIQGKQTSCQDTKSVNDTLQEQLQESEKAKQMVKYFNNNCLYVIYFLSFLLIRQ